MTRPALSLWIGTSFGCTTDLLMVPVVVVFVMMSSFRVGGSPVETAPVGVRNPMSECDVVPVYDVRRRVATVGRCSPSRG